MMLSNTQVIPRYHKTVILLSTGSMSLFRMICVYIFIHKFYLHELDIDNVYRVITLMTLPLKKSFLYHLANKLKTSVTHKDQAFGKSALFLKIDRPSVHLPHTTYIA